MGGRPFAPARPPAAPSVAEPLAITAAAAAQAPAPPAAQGPTGPLAAAYEYTAYADMIARPIGAASKTRKTLGTAAKPAAPRPFTLTNRAANADDVAFRQSVANEGPAPSRSIRAKPSTVGRPRRAKAASPLAPAARPSLIADARPIPAETGAPSTEPLMKAPAPGLKPLLQRGLAAPPALSAPTYARVRAAESDTKKPMARELIGVNAPFHARPAKGPSAPTRLVVQVEGRRDAEPAREPMAPLGPALPAPTRNGFEAEIIEPRDAVVLTRLVAVCRPLKVPSIAVGEREVREPGARQRARPVNGRARGRPPAHRAGQAPASSPLGDYKARG